MIEERHIAAFCTVCQWNKSKQGQMHFLFGRNRPTGSNGQTPRGEAAWEAKGTIWNTVGCPSVLLAFSIGLCLADFFLIEPGPTFPGVVLAWKYVGEEHSTLCPTSPGQAPRRPLAAQPTPLPGLQQDHLISVNGASPRFWVFTICYL